MISDLSQTGEQRRHAFGAFRQIFDSWLNLQVNAGRVLLGIAILSGMALRFNRLDAMSMTADEGAAWAAAAEPVKRLLALQPQLDSGKLALYDLLLHYWIAMFGDSLRAIRSLSAAIGAISILLIFWMVRELAQGGTAADSQSELVGGIAALLFATNVALVDSARTGRMYPLMTAAELVQIFFFVRAQRQGRAVSYILAALFLSLAIAANFTAAFLVVAESLWVGYLLIARCDDGPGRRCRIAASALSLVGGGLLLLPFAPGALAASRTALREGALDWIRYRPPLSWFCRALLSSVGNRWLFRLFLALAAFGVWRHRTGRAPNQVFMGAMMIGPLAAIAILGLLGRPMMVDRYVILAQLGFLVLAALGVAAFRSNIGTALIVLLIVWLSARALRHFSVYWVDWRGAVAIACATTSFSHERLGVVPEYAANVVRYYLPPERRAQASGLDSQCGTSQILIISPGPSIPPGYIAELNACYPHLLGRATRAEIRAR